MSPVSVEVLSMDITPEAAEENISPPDLLGFDGPFAMWFDARLLLRSPTDVWVSRKVIVPAGGVCSPG